MGTQQAIGGRIFALQIEETKSDPSMIQGMLLLLSTCVQALFDFGVLHSFISTAYFTELALKTEPLSTSMKVASSLEVSVAICLVCRGCKLEVANLCLTCDLKVIDMVNFDIILGMDWLSAHRAIIDCHQKMVTAYTPDGIHFQFKRDRQTTNSTTRRSKWQNQLFGWLASLQMEEADRMELGLPHIVCEYADVFPEELPGLSPHREIRLHHRTPIQNRTDFYGAIPDGPCKAKGA
ncbi:uncharacterized protein LOC131306938 [Rhododendron vialii]|uniref:uncharacterized protein LOC131306938 n=1 Tax=Rhododendron vialii TaxID=182163 RepID=UPI00265EFAC1|nr:uncharacterized protein LOC131306938 [Rhododendron vialii]